MKHQIVMSIAMAMSVPMVLAIAMMVVTMMLAMVMFGVVGDEHVDVVMVSNKKMIGWW